MQLIISDDHGGLHKARQAVFAGVPWQGCQNLHLQQNASAGACTERSECVPRKAMQKEVAADIRMIFNAPNREPAESYLKQVVGKYTKEPARLADWMEANIPEGLNFFEFPQEHWRRT